MYVCILCYKCCFYFMKKTLQNLEDAEADAMMLDETDKIP